MIDLNMLKHIPADDYDIWLKVGMALKHEGASLSVWEDWSSGGSKYVPGECEKKWNSFNSDGVTGGTLYHIAQEYGYRPVYDNTDYDIRNLLLAEAIVDPSFVSPQKLPPLPSGYDPKGDMLEYLNTLFEPGDFVGFCTEFFQDERGSWKPSRTQYRRTVESLIDGLRSGTIEQALGGKLNEEAGAYIRFNPLDGKGEQNSNVTRWKYCLIESDTDSVEKQYSLLKEMNLPITFLVSSGGKSLHAITRVDAENAQQYRQRVRELYEFCRRSGLTPDEQDKNESRFSRLPGVKRGDKWQYIVERNIGAKSYDEWIEWREEQADDLPPIETLADVWNDMPPLKPELIPGILRVGHKMLLSAPSKSGKSFLLMNLAIAIANGTEWLGMKCRQGKVLYVNCEIDSASTFHRLKEICESQGIGDEHLKDLSIWSLRGRSVPMSRLAPIMVRRFKDQGFVAVIIDPIYKVITGDENNATEMSEFCSYFDRVASDMGVSVIYCHHHSKGASGKYSNSADRSSGSGVFARDPDAILDMRRLNVEGAEEKYRKYHPGDCEATAFEISTTLREFPTMKPMRVWFDYPLHVPDTENFLASARYQDSVDSGKGVGKGQKKKKDWLQDAENLLALSALSGDTAISLEQLVGMSESNAKRTFGKDTDYELATVDDQKVIHRRDDEEITFGGKTYKRGNGRQWEISKVTVTKPFI